MDARSLSSGLKVKVTFKAKLHKPYFTVFFTKKDLDLYSYFTLCIMLYIGASLVLTLYMDIFLLINPIDLFAWSFVGY